MTKININTGNYTPEVDVLVQAGYRYVTYVPRGENKGNVISKHKTRDLAERAAKGKDRSICDLLSLADIGLV